MGMWRSLHPFHSSTPKPSRRRSVKQSVRRRAQQRRSANSSRAARREMQLERFEERLLLTAAPQLLSILTNNNDVVFASNSATQPLASAPRELDLLFNEGQVIDPSTLGGIQIVRAGVDHTLNTSDDVPVQPGYIGIGSMPNQVVVRFASTLPDDLYQITLLGAGPDALTNSSDPPVPFSSGNPTQANQQIDFQVDTSPRVLSVIPEPVTRNADGSLSQSADTIDVYFNKPIQPLPQTINQLDPHLFQLVATQNTADPSDDLVFTPTTVSFNLATNMAQLTFAAPISSLGTGSFRLRIGDNQAVATGSNATPVTVPLTVGSAGSTFGDTNTLTQDPGPYQVGNLNATSHQLLTGGFIGPVSGLPATATPGGNIGPGLSGIPIDNHVDPNAQQPSGQTHYLPTITYNFPNIYGSVPGNPQLHNVITPAQQQLAREIFQLYGYYYGVQFQEVSSATMGDAELGIVTGVVQALNQSAPVGLTGIAQPPASPFPVLPDASRPEALAVMNAGIFNTESQYGGPWFMEAMRQIGILLGLTNVNDAPPGTVMGSSGAAAEPVFPGNADILHGRYLYQPDSNAINMYKFTLTTPGTFSAETVAQRLTDPSGAPTTSLLNTVLTLYNETHVIQLPTTGANAVGATIVPSSTFTLNDGTNPAVTFAFDNGITPIPAGAVSIPYLASQTAHDVAVSLADTINNYLTTHSLNVSASVQFDRVVLSGPLTVTHSASQGSVAYSIDREIVSRNDDYFGTDSFVKLQLGPGNYYLAVTSTGNTSFNPNVPNSGAGGTTTGAYDLRLDLTPAPVSTLTDDGLSLIVPNVPVGGQGGIQDLDKFTITHNGVAVTFQFVLPGSTPAANVTAIPVTAGELQDQVAQAVLNAIAATPSLVNPSPTNELGLAPRYDGHGQVNVGGSATTTITTTSSPLVVWGTSARHVLQGNSDGQGSGAYNFWFASNDASTIFVDKLSAATSDSTLGTIANPYNNIASALQAAADRIVAPAGAAFLGGAPQTFVVNDGTYAVTFEFSVNGAAVANGHIAVAVQSTDTADQVAQEIFNAIQSAALSGFLTLSPSFAPPAAGSNIVDVAGASFVDVKNAPALLSGTKIVRVVGNIGGDNSLGVPINPQPSVSTLAPSGSTGQTFNVTSGTLSLTFEFTSNASLTPGALLADGNYAVVLATGASAQDIANAMAAAINASPLAQAAGGAVVASVSGDAVAFRVNLTGTGQIAINAQNTPSLIAASNAQPYLIGYDQFTHQPLADGGDLVVPQGVTLMIDAGAVFKLEGANINVGLNSPNIDRSGAALQVLGTPDSSVYFTSFHDNQLGGITDNVTAPSPGDYGGIVFHQDSDQESQGIFLNSVNHANIRYAGGTVVVDGVPATYNPIYLDGSRPTIAYNTITQSHDAAMSADPNSFQETIFGSSAYDPAAVNPSIGPYVADYNRTGPDILGNLLSVTTPGGVAIVAVDASQIVDGETFIVETVNGNGATTYTTFEFDSNGSVAAGNVKVAFNPGKPAQNIAGDTALQIAAAIVNAVNLAGIGGVSASVRTVVTGNGTLQEAVVSGVSKIELPSSRAFNAPTGQSIVDGQTFKIVNPANGVTAVFEFNSSGGVAAGHIAVPFLAADSAAVLAGKIAAAISGANLGIAAVASGTRVVLTSDPNVALATTGSGVGAGQQSVTVSNGNALASGSTFSVTNKSTGAKTVFEFATNAALIVNGKLADGNYAILYSTTTQAAAIATSVATAVNNLGLGITAIASGGTVVFSGLPSFRFASPLSISSSVVANTVNGLFIRTQDVQGQQPETLDVAARFTSTDIVYVISDNLVIQGNPGGPVDNTPRISGRLAIDPGVVVKLLGARIEVQMGANLIAEGEANQQIIFTSLHDDSFGAGGTFDTNGDNFNLTAPPSVVQPGDWSGVYFAPTSRGSLDHAMLAYGGGSSTIAGGTDNFNVVEIRQAQVRIANSTLESNAAGLATTPTRAGMLSNDSAAIYVLGAQPIIVNNVLRDNFGAAISINANSLTSDVVPDLGRSTGAIERSSDFDDNRGPLVRLNRIGNVANRQAINGMLVRGATLDTSSVWDDTDIVHVVTSEISVPNVDSRGGLLLESSASQSLVVKLKGDDAGFTATGTPSDIQNRIGGSVQIIGTPGHNVVLTAIGDETVGAGLTPDGLPQNLTDNGTTLLTGESLLPTIPNVDRGTLIDNNVATSVVGHFEANIGVGGDLGSADPGGPNLIGVTAQGNQSLLLNANFLFDYGYYVQKGASGAPTRLSATTITQQPTLVAPDVVVSKGNFQGANGTVNWTVTSSFQPGTTQLVNTISLSSAQAIGALRFINYLDEDVPPSFSDDILYVQGTPGQPDFKVFTLDGPQRVGVSQSGIYAPGPGLSGATYEGWAADTFPNIESRIVAGTQTFTIPGNINTANDPPFNDPSLGLVYGLRDQTTAFSWLADPTASSVTITTFLGEVATAPALPGGQWRSVKLDQNSNDNNVAVVNEAEPASTGGVDSNGTVGAAQVLGTLAPNLKSGDDNQRLGFVVNGTISPNAPGDMDVYRFQAQPGTQVWIDIGQTSPGLDTVVELVDANGTVIARSDNSAQEAADPSLLQSELAGNQAMPMQGDTLLHGIYDPNSAADPALRDLNSTNPYDAGFRVVLPASANQTQPLASYYVRVRSKGADPHYNDLRAGLSSGVYQLQVRLREQEEFPGSTVQNADIRFATNGIEVIGLPAHSPLIAEAGSSQAAHNTLATVQDLGNLLTTDRNTIGVSGNLSSSTAQDWYKFELNYDLAQVIAGLNDGDKTFSTMFDIDYADGLSRPNTTISVFDAAGNLIYVGRDSNVGNDQPLPGQGSSSALSDLTRASVGQLDPFIGAVQLPAGATRTYYVAISSDATLPTALNATFVRGAAQPLVRLEPIDSLNRVMEDHVGSQGGQTAQDPKSLTAAFNGDTSSQAGVDQLNSSATGFKLSDVVLFVDQAGNNGHLQTVNPFTGQTQTDVGAVPSTGSGYDDIAMRNDGRLYGFTLGAINVGGGNYNLIDTGNATIANQGNNGVVTYGFNTANPPVLTANNTGVQVHALAFNQGTGANNRQLFGIASYAGGVGVPGFVNGLYQFDPNTGAVLGKTGNATNPTDPPPRIVNLLGGPGGQITGMTFVNGTLYVITSLGGLFTISNPAANATATYVGTATALAGINFTSLTAGPPNADGGKYANDLFAADATGKLWCFDTSGVLQNVFANGAASISLGLSSVVGLAFSTLDYNLWHVTNNRGTDPGHGINVAPDESRDPASANQPQLGNTSFYFGLEPPPSADPNSLNANSQPDAANYASNASVYHTYNLPGGAQGSLVTNAFSLSNYAVGDKPTLYFNYFLATQQASATPANPTGMRDSARVFASVDGGKTWQMLATNDPEVPLTKSDPNGELPSYTSVSSNTGSGDLRQQVQPLFDGTGSWRQARIDLGAYAGYSNIQLRFDFSTAGSMGQLGLPGDNFGNPSSPQRGQDNAHEGWYVDDITVGFAERGEMVTGATANSTFFTVPQNPNVGAPQQILTGPYQLEIRQGTTYGQTVDPLTPDITLTQSFDTNDRLASGFTIIAPSGAAVVDGQTFTVSDGIRTVVFEFDNNNSLERPGDVRVPFQTSYTAAQMANAIAAAVNANTTLKGVTAGTVNNSVLNLTAPTGASLTDGQTFTVTDQFGHSVVFEYDSNGSVQSGRAAVPFTLASTSAQVAANLSAAISGASTLLGLKVNVITTGSTSLVVVGGVAASTTTGNRVEVYGAASVSSINSLQGNISVSFNNPTISSTNVDHGSVSENGGTTSIWVTSSAPAGTQTTVTLKAIDLADAAGINPPLSSNVSLQYNNQSGSSITLTLTGGQPQLVTVTGLPQLDANNQPIADGPQAVELVAAAAGYSSNSATVDVTDDPTLLPAISLSIDSPKSIVEESPTPIMATIKLNAPPLDHDLIVKLQSLNPGAATTPATVTIPAGQTSATFPISPFDNNVINPGGKQTAVILATAGGFLGGSDTLTVLDDGNGTITFNSGPTYVPQGPSHIINGQSENVPDPANPGANDPVEGAIETVLADPSNPNVVYVGAVNGGIWKTTNAMSPAGPTWTPLTDSLPSLSIGALQFDQADPTHQTLIAAVGRFSSFALTGGKLDGLMRSTDGGQSWSLINPGGFFDGKNLTGVAEFGATIVATDNGFLGGNGGLYQSTDGGVTFTNISGLPNSGLPAGPVSDLAVDPNNTNRMYAGVLGVSGGIFMSLNRGQTWTNVTPAGLTLNGIPFDDNIRIAVSSAAGSPVYFGYVSNGQLANLYRSADFGTTWQALDLPLTNENGTTEGLQPGGTESDLPPGSQGVIHFSIAADPTNPNLVYVGGDRQPGPGDGSATFPNSLGARDYSGRLFRGDASKPSGSQWTSLTHNGTASNSAPHADSRHLTFDGNVLLETDDGGIYMRTSPQSTSGDWLSLIGNLQITELHNIAYDENTKTIMGGAQDNGTPEQLPGSTTWNNAAGGDGGDVAVDDSNPNFSIRYTSSQDLLGFAATTYDLNGNQIGQPAFPSLIVNGSGGQDIYQFDIGLPFVTSFKLNAVDPTRMVIGGGSTVYESADDGNTLTSLGVGGVPGGIFGAAMAYGGRIVDQFGNITNNPNVLWIGAGNRVYLRSTAGGALLQSNYAGANVTALEINPNNWQQAFVTDSNGHVWMTTDQGNSFVDISGPTGGATSFTTLTSNPQSIAFVPGTSSGTLFVGGIDGVYSTVIGSSGASNVWARYGQGLPHVPVYDLEYVPSQQLLVIGTMGRGAFVTNALGASGNLTVTVNGAKQVSDDANLLTQKLTIARNGTTGDLTVSLSSSDPTLASVPAAVTIPDGASSITVDVTVSDSILAQYPATVVFTASVGGLNSISDSLDIVPDANESNTPLDNDTPALTVSIPAGSQIQADTGISSVVATVTRNTPVTYPLTVYLLSSDPSKASVPVSVVIPAGQSSASFLISAVDQFAGDISRLITITAAASGFASGLDAVTVDPATHVQAYDRLGDPNLLREQGQIVLQGNKISNSLDYGIVVEAAPRNQATGQSVPGVVQNLSTLNTSRLAPGATIENNLIVGGGKGGINFLGDPNATSDALAAVPFGRIVNNTIYGAATPAGIGVNVAQNASPTILNNIFANLATGISVDATSGSTVEKRSIYQNNGTNLSGAVFGGPDVNSLALSPSAKLFANPATGNFYLLPGSAAIDSALNSLDDRTAMLAAKTLTGIPGSPINAPSYDLYGQLRTANPQTTPNGVGSTQFKDRGAIESVDFTGPTSSLANPIDNDSLDQEPALNVVHDVGATLTDFEIRFNDANGVGIDDSTIDSSKFVLYRNGTLLQPGIDYFFRYDVNSKTAYFTPATGTWQNGNAYTIAVNNGVHFDPFNTSTPANSSNGVKDLAGNLLQANSATGFTRYDVLLQNSNGDAPSIGVPGVQSVLENGTNGTNSLVFSNANGNAITVFNIDAPSNLVTVTLSTQQGTLKLAGLSGLTGVSGNNSASVTFTGSLTAINAALNGLTFSPTPFLRGSASISISATDTARQLTGAGTAIVAIIPVNQPPYLTLPSSPSILENTGLVFSTGNGNAITMGDFDADSTSVEKVTMTVTNGAVTLATKTGLTILSGAGFNDTTVSFQGTLAAINAAFNGMLFTPALNFAGTSSIQFTLDDLGNSGNGPQGQPGVFPATSPFTLNINVTPVNQPPFVKQPNPLNNLIVNENSPPTVIDLTQVIGDPDTANVPPELYPTVAVTGNTNPGLVSVSINPVTHLMTLTYGANQSGLASITLTAVDAGGNHPTLTYTFNVKVNLVHLAPVANNDGYVYVPGVPLAVSSDSGVLANDVELNHEPIVAKLFNVPSHGQLTLNVDGSFTYVPDVGFDGRDSFVYKVDNGYFRIPATVTLDTLTSRWVARMYTEVLGRATSPSDAEVNYWVSQLDHGVSRQQVADFFVTSPERRSTIISQLYTTYLGRAVDQAGLNYWLSVWAANQGPEQVQAGIIGSAEYFRTAANELPNLTPAAAWVTKLYENLLHRDPGPDEVNYWTTFILSNSRQSVVLGFVTSDEYRLGLMQGIPDFPGQPSLPGWYEQYLHRPIDNSGAQYWLAQMKAGYPQEAILKGIVASDEYVRRA